MTTTTIALKFPERVPITLQTIDGILDNLVNCVIESNRSMDASVKFIFHFSKIIQLDSNVTPAIRKFAREHNVRGVHICHTRHDVSRKILTNMGGFFNLDSVLLDSSAPGEAELCLPLVLRKTVSSITELTFANMALSSTILQEWASVLGSCSSKHGPPLTSLVFTNVVFDDSFKSVKIIGNILKHLLYLKEFRFEYTSTVSGGGLHHQERYKVMFGPLAYSLSRLPYLQKLTLTDVNIEGSDDGVEEFFATDSLVRKSLQELSLVDCNISVATVRLLSFNPWPFEKLETVDVSKNPLLSLSDVVKLEKKYNNVVHDFCIDSSGDEFGSDDDSTTEVEDTGNDAKDTDDEPWDFTQMDTLHLNEIEF